MLSKILARILCFSFDDIISLYSVLAGPFILCSALWVRLWSDYWIALISDIPVFIGGLLCVLEAVPLWRSTFHAGFIIGYSAILAGLSMGFFSVWWWIFAPVYTSDYTNVNAILAFIHQFDLAHGYWAGEICWYLMFVATLSTLLLCALKIYSHIRGKPFFKLVFDQRYYWSLVFLSWVTITYCVTAAVFFANPNKTKHSDWFGWGWIQTAFFSSANFLCLMFSVMIAAAFVCWLTLIYAPTSHACVAHLLTVCLPLVLISHILVTVAGIAGFDNWSLSIQPHKAVWVVFLISSCLMVFVTGLHVAVHYSSSKDQDLRLESNSIPSSWTSIRPAPATERNMN